MPNFFVLKCKQLINLTVHLLAYLQDCEIVCSRRQRGHFRVGVTVLSSCSAKGGFFASWERNPQRRMEVCTGSELCSPRREMNRLTFRLTRWSQRTMTSRWLRVCLLEQKMTSLWKRSCLPFFLTGCGVCFRICGGADCDSSIPRSREPYQCRWRECRLVN